MNKIIKANELKALMPRSINYAKRINDLVNDINNQLSEAAKQDKSSISIELTEDDFFAIRDDLQFGGYHFEITQYNATRTKFRLVIGW